jgi:hypothetical protein
MTFNTFDAIWRRVGKLNKVTFVFCFRYRTQTLISSSVIVLRIRKRRWQHVITALGVAGDIRTYCKAVSISVWTARGCLYDSFNTNTGLIILMPGLWETARTPRPAKTTGKVHSIPHELSTYICLDVHLLIKYTAQRFFLFNNAFSRAGLAQSV